MDQAFTLLTLKIDVTHFPTPRPVDYVRSFLGLAGYYRAFVRNFASIAFPLTRLLKKDTPLIWHDARIQAFETLRHALTQALVLGFPDYTQPFTMCTDASALPPFLPLSQVGKLICL